MEGTRNKMRQGKQYNPTFQYEEEEDYQIVLRRTEEGEWGWQLYMKELEGGEWPCRGSGEATSKGEAKIEALLAYGNWLLRKEYEDEEEPADG